MPTTTAPPRPAETRHADVAGRLQAAITGGKYVVGSLLPGEHELAQAHGVSRQTVRTALQALQDRGFITRKKGVGSRVESQEPTAGYSHVIDSLDDLVRVAAVEVRRIDAVERVTLERRLARQLQAPLGSSWVCFSGLRVDAARADRPISWARIYVDARFSRITAKVRAEPDVLVATLLERECGQSIEEVDQHVFATLLDDTLATALGAAPGGPALRVLRHYKAAKNTILEITETIYPGDRMSISTQLRRTRPLKEAL